MRKKRSEQTELQKLQKEWYQKLKDSGFKDIELDSKLSIMPNYTNGNHTRLKQRNMNNSETRDYYTYACQFYHDFTFDNSIEKHIWFLHSRCTSERKIATIIDCDRQKVRLVLRKIKNNYFIEYIKKRVQEIEEDRKFTEDFELP